MVTAQEIADRARAREAAAERQDGQIIRIGNHPKTCQVCGQEDLRWATVYVDPGHQFFRMVHPDGSRHTCARWLKQDVGIRWHYRTFGD